MKNFFKKPAVIVFVVFMAAAALGLYFKYGRNKPVDYETMAVVRRAIAQEVDVTGRVNPAEEVDLAFERGGRAVKINVKVGDSVSVGQELVGLDQSELAADLNKSIASFNSAQASRIQYQAALENQQALLDELKSGTRSEELVVAEIKVSNAKQILADSELNLNNTQHQADVTLANFYDSVSNILNDAYAKADDAVTKQVDDFFSDDNSNPRLSFITSNSQAQIDVERQRAEMTPLLADFRSELNSLTDNQILLDAALVMAETRLASVRDFLVNLTDTVNTSSSLSQATVTAYKGYLNTARLNVYTALGNASDQRQSIISQKAVNRDNLDAAQAKVNQARDAVTLAENELILKQSGPTAEQLRAKEAAVRQAEAVLKSQDAVIAQATAVVDNLRAQLSKMTMISPINGVITKQDAKVGEIISANTVLVSVISVAKFEIEANVPEADIAKIGVGALADVTLDAYGDDVIFKAAVSAIDPAEKIIEGVATYKITLQFSNGDSRIKSGMTANVEVVGERRDNVLAVPQRIVAVKDGQRTVQVMNDDASILEVPVKTGLRGSDGYIEILEGLKEGDKVIVATKIK